MAEKRGRGRPKGSLSGPMSQEHRDKIAKSNILSRLIRHAEGLEQMESTEVNAASILLRKVLPDLQSVDLTAEVGVSVNIAKDDADL